MGEFRAGIPLGKKEDVAFEVVEVVLLDEVPDFRSESMENPKDCEDLLPNGEAIGGKPNVWTLLRWYIALACVGCIVMAGMLGLWCPWSGFPEGYGYMAASMP